MSWKPRLMPLIFVLSACAGTPAKPPQAPDSLVVLLNDLEGAHRDLAKAEAAIRTLPKFPELQYLTLEQMVNKDAEGNYFGNPNAVLDSGHRVAVIGAIGHVVGQDDKVHKYVSDALIFAVKQQNPDLHLNDREYEALLTAEAGRATSLEASAPSEASRQPVEEGNGEAEGTAVAAARTAGLDYLVIVHAVYDNVTTAKPESIQHELGVHPDDWAKYEKEVAEYRRAYQDYAEAIQEYNRYRQELVEGAMKRGDWPSWEGYFEEYEKFQKKSGYTGKVTAGLLDKAAPATPFRLDYYVPEDDKEERKLTVEDLAREALDLAIFQRGFPGYRPAAELPRFPADYRELLPKDKAPPASRVVIYQFKLSVRVLDVKKGEMVWIGVVEAQNLSYLDALRSCSLAIAEHLVLPPN